MTKDDLDTECVSDYGKGKRGSFLLRCLHIGMIIGYETRRSSEPKCRLVKVLAVRGMESDGPSIISALGLLKDFIKPRGVLFIHDLGGLIKV